VGWGWESELEVAQRGEELETPGGEEWALVEGTIGLALEGEDGVLTGFGVEGRKAGFCVRDQQIGGDWLIAKVAEIGSQLLPQGVRRTLSEFSLLRASVVFVGMERAVHCQFICSALHRL
jgi:hypothetical protein